MEKTQEKESADIEVIDNTTVVNSSETSLPDVTVDEDEVSRLEKLLAEQKKVIATKLYPIKMDAYIFKRFKDFFKKCEWTGKQALGIVEILNRLNEIQEAGITDNQILLSNLEIEASHFFLNSYKGKGGYEAKDHIYFIKSIEEGLNLIQPDNRTYKDLENQLNAAKQGLKLE